MAKLLAITLGRQGPEVYNSKFFSVLLAAGMDPEDVMLEYLDLNRNRDTEFRTRKKELILHQYLGKQIDLIVAVEQPALIFLLEELKDLAPGVPVMAINATVPKDALTSGHPFLQKTVNLDFKGTLERALELFPETRRVVVVTGAAEQDLVVKTESQATADLWKDKLEFEYTDHMSMAEIQRRVANLPHQTIVIYRAINRDRTGQIYVPYNALLEITKVANAPVFGLYDNYVGATGVVGGSVYHIAQEGERAAHIALAIMEGSLHLNEPLKTLPSEGVPMFDWQQINRWGGNESRLPTDSIFVNRASTLWGQYKAIIISMVIVFLVMATLIASLLIQNRRRKVAENLTRESEERYRSLIEEQIELVSRFKPDGTFLYANEGFCQFFGRSKDMFEGSKWHPVAHPDDMPVIEKRLSCLSPDNPVVLIENRVFDANGQLRWVEFSNKAFFEGNGTLSEIQSVGRDITERKRAEEALKRSEQKSKAILESISDAFFSLDSNLVITYFNSAAERVLNRKAGEVLGRYLFDAFPEATGSVFDEKYHQAAREKTALNFEVYFDIAPYRNWYEVRVYPQDEGISVYFQVITDRKRSEMLMEKRLELSSFAVEHTISQVLQKTLDIAEEITSSCIGFYHFIDEANHNIILQQWSSRTVREFCTAKDYDLHYGIDKGGVWADCIRQRSPVVHNDYPSLSYKKGMSEGHAPVVRELVVPIFRKERIVAILGVGNKPIDYTDKDIDIVTFFADFAWDVAERKKAEDELREKTIIAQTFMDALPCVALLLKSKTREIVALNKTAYEAGARIGSTCFGSWPKADKPCFFCGAPDAWKTGKHRIKEVESLGVIWEAHWVPVTENLYLHYALDITERKQAEAEREKLQAQLNQAQKMESIGTLAGGIAHDFNNILFPIVGHVEMLLEDTPKDNPMRESLNEVYTGALRARDLVQQILAFSRQGSTELKLMKMQPIIKEALKLIRSTIPTIISIDQSLQQNCGAIKADPTQIHQILMNLATNAYHAMEETGGELKVSLKEVELGQYDLIHPDMKPGLYACLTVADTGIGMNKEVMNKIFDPFFTTKGKGKGTGMGLSVVHGIVKRMDGEIQVHSEPNKGTAFHIFLPIVQSDYKKQELPTNLPIRGGMERVLLVDDEEAIITMEKLVLERLGYQVSARMSSVDALEAFRAGPEKYNIVITDMSMPVMRGDKLAAELIKIRSDIPILLCTGFSESMTEEKIKSIGIKGLLMKPVVVNDLAQKIRSVLNEDKNV